MSLETWIKEFYPVSIHDIKSDEDAIKHSIKKWEGLQPENLVKHEVMLSGWQGAYLINSKDNEVDFFEINIDIFQISSTTCALCYLHIDNDCVTCPLFKKMGFVCGGGKASKDGWTSFHETANTSLMLKNLKSLIMED